MSERKGEQKSDLPATTTSFSKKRKKISFGPSLLRPSSFSSLLGAFQVESRINREAPRRRTSVYRRLLIVWLLRPSARVGETTRDCRSRRRGDVGLGALAVPKRSLMGPGPSNAHPRVLAAQGGCCSKGWRCLCAAKAEMEKTIGPEGGGERTTAIMSIAHRNSNLSAHRFLFFLDTLPPPPPKHSAPSPRPHAPSFPRHHGRDQAGAIVAVPDSLQGNLPRQRHGHAGEFERVFSFF